MAYFFYRCRDWSYFKTMVLISVYLNIQYNYKYMTWLCVDQEIFWGVGGGVSEGYFLCPEEEGWCFFVYTMGILKAGSDSPAAPQPHYKMFKFSIHRYESTFVHCVKTVTATFRSVYRDLVWNPKHLVDYTCRKKNYLYLIQCVENTLPFSPHDQ